MAKDKESDKKRTEEIKNTLTPEQQKEFDIGMKAIEKYTGLFKRLAKT